MAATIREMGAEPRFFEEFSSPDNPAQVYNPEVARDTIYLFIAGEQYGEPVPGDRQARSATHIEYDTAYAAYKPILAYNKTGEMGDRQEGDRVQVEALCRSAQEITGGMIEVAFADQGYTGVQTLEDAHKSNVELIVVKRLDASRGFVLLPKRWVVERSLAWLARFRRLGRDLERLSSTVMAQFYGRS